MRILELDAEERAAEHSSELLIRVSWPFQVWKCSVPKNLHPNINILEKLILSLADKKLLRTKSEIKQLLCSEIGIDPTLIEKAMEECDGKGYFDHRYSSEIVITSEGKKTLDACTENSDLDEGLESTDERDFVYLFYSMTANAVIPRFDITELPQAINRNDNEILCMPDNSQGPEKFPGALQLRNAIKAWRHIYRQQISGEESTATTDEKGTPLKTGSTKDKEANIIIQMSDDHPTRVDLQGYLLINRYRPDHLIAISPFGANYDNYFEGWLERVRGADKDFNAKLNEIATDRKEIAAQLIAFENTADVHLFDDVPQICNNPKYIELKNRVIDMHDFLKKPDKEQNRAFYSFGQNYRTSIDLVLGYAMDCHPELEDQREKLKKLPRDQQLNTMKVLLRKSGIKMSFSDNVLRNVLTGGPRSRNTKDMLALMIIYASENPNSIIASYLSANEQWLAEIPGIINLIGNAAAHGNTIKSHDSAEKYYEKMERIIKNSFQYLIEGGK